MLRFIAALFASLLVRTNAVDISDRLTTKGPYKTTYSCSTITNDQGQCQLQQVHAFIRHGTRNPSIGDVSNFNALTDILNESHPFHLSQAGMLVPQGERDMYEFGQRLQCRYLHLLSEPGRFQSSDVERTSQSLSALTLGLYEGLGNVTSAHIRPVPIARPEPRDRDTLISMKYACPRYNAVPKRDMKVRSELSKFSETRITPIKRKLEEKLNVGLSNNSYANAVYGLCAYYIAHGMNYKKWCDLLSPEDFEIFEFQNDLEDYYMHSYGHEINTQLACVLIDDIKTIMLNPQKEKLRVFLGHAEGIMFLLTYLGYMNDFNPEIYRGDATMAEIREHGFRTSNIPFAANLLFELWICEGTPKVRVILNEDKVILETSLDELGTSTCNYADICGLPHLRFQGDFFKVN